MYLLRRNSLFSLLSTLITLPLLACLLAYRLFFVVLSWARTSVHQKKKKDLKLNINPPLNIFKRLLLDCVPFPAKECWRMNLKTRAALWASSIHFAMCSAVHLETSSTCTSRDNLTLYQRNSTLRSVPGAEAAAEDDGEHVFICWNIATDLLFV